ncbi:hypothetical protein JW930_01120 [Candidatus Woesearchaeota archaeon]|nr:hypothetical protein [Candidatus Woesearchaeota archaeon]
MWLIIILIATILASALFLLLKGYRKKLKLGFLTLMLFGTFLMVLVDHAIAFINGEPFIEITTDGLIRSATLLGFVMVIPILVIWILAVLISFKPKHTS